MADRKDSRLTGINPLAYLGVEPVAPVLFFSAQREPTANDYDNYNIGHLWLDRSSGPDGEVWMLVKKDAHVATWRRMGASFQFDTDGGSAIPAAGVLNVLGGLNIDTSGAGNTVTIKTPTLAEGPIYVNGAGVYTSLGTAADGEVLIGATGTTPSWANLTSSGGTVVITNGSGTINLEATGGGVVNAGENINITPIAVVNLNETIHWPHTDATGNVGMIYLGGAGGAGGTRFMHNYTETSMGITAGSNVFLGLGAGNLTIANNLDDNTGIGYQSLMSLTTGGSNTAIGDQSLTKLTTGTCNCAFGDDALEKLTTGSWNVGIAGNISVGAGQGAGSNYTSSESSNIVINSSGVLGDNNTIRLGTHGSGNRQQDKCFIAGIRGITTGVADAVQVLIDSSYQLGTVSSSIKTKQNVEDMGDESSKVMKLRPVTFEYKKHPGIQQFGLIAEEVDEVFPRLVARSGDGDIETVKYNELPAILLNEMQKMAKRIADLEDKLDSLEEMV